MNKYQEAIILVREILNTTEPNVMKHLAANRKLDHELQELVDKATPKKPVITIHNGFCPNCHQAFGLERTKQAMIRPYWLSFCPYCGQAIDWSTDDE